MDKITEKALKLHKQGNNCCQSVCLAFADKLNIDEDVLFKISEGFGAGMGNLQGSCGALTAAVIVAGICNSGGKDAETRTKTKTYRLVSQINNQFIDLVGSMSCKEIKGVGTGKVLKSCDGCIETAVYIVNNLIFREGES